MVNNMNEAEFLEKIEKVVEKVIDRKLDGRKIKGFGGNRNESMSAYLDREIGSINKYLAAIHRDSIQAIVDTQTHIDDTIEPECHVYGDSRIKKRFPYNPEKFRVDY